MDRQVRNGRTLGLLAALAVAAPLALLGPSAASASEVGCTGTACDHRSPVVNGCTADAEEVAAVIFSEGAAGSSAKMVVRLMYSPACNASWSRVSSDGNGTISVDWSRAWMGNGHRWMTQRSRTGEGRVQSLMLSGSTIEVCGRTSWNDSAVVRTRCTSAG